MTRADATAILNASRELLGRGDAVGAERLLGPMLPSLRSDASALHLMGLIKRAQNQMDEAERLFRGAIAQSFNEAGYYNDLGVVLQMRGAFEEALKVYRAALALTPHAAATRVNVVHCLLAASKFADAETEAGAFVEAVPGAESWMLLSQVYRAQDKNKEALSAAATALKHAPRMRALQMNYATALERAGHVKDALQHYAKLAAERLDSVELANQYARALYRAGEHKEAEAVLERGVQQWPDSALLHTALARVRELRGERLGATALLEQEIGRKPEDVALRLACADTLHRAGQWEKALRLVEEGLARNGRAAGLINARGILLDELDRPKEALETFARVANAAPDSRAAQRNLLSTLIRAGKAEEALTIARRLRADDPFEQYLIACEALALRVLGDPAYAVLYDYAKLVRTYEIAAPRGFFTIENFNAALADVLRHQHKLTAHPFDQTLRNGSQTPRTLLSLDEPNIAAFRAALEPAIRDYISKLDGEDPVSQRKSARYRFAGMWSTLLGEGGSQPNHVHDRGWISAAYFVAVDSEATAGAGRLKLGEPNRPAPNCAPELWIDAKPGTLALFPSYMWHGVEKFGGRERLTASFDIIPA